MFIQKDLLHVVRPHEYDTQLGAEVDPSRICWLLLNDQERYDLFPLDRRDDLGVPENLTES
jgi:hypothetical protein